MRRLLAAAVGLNDAQADEVRDAAFLLELLLTRPIHLLETNARSVDKLVDVGVIARRRLAVALVGRLLRGALVGSPLLLSLLLERCVQPLLENGHPARRLSGLG